ncbi:MAG: NINE protein [Bacteroidetes bacterium]|nr:MAG: NINE protein [Bacteroidota bacterium]
MDEIIEKPKKDKIVAALLSWFLGLFGVHKFYLGQTGAGIGYLIATCTIVGMLFTGIASIVDFFSLLLMSKQDFDRKYNPEHYFAEKLGQTYLFGSPTGEVKDVADEILKLDGLFKSGVITFEEFEKRKAKLLA